MTTLYILLYALGIAGLLWFVRYQRRRNGDTITLWVCIAACIYQILDLLLA